MEFTDALSLLAALFGLLGAIFLVKSVALINPKGILALMVMYQDIAGSPEHISSMATQKADAQIGLVFVFSAFLFQIISLAIVPESAALPIARTKQSAIVAIVLLVLILATALYFFSIRLRKRIALQVWKLDFRNERCLSLIRRKFEHYDHWENWTRHLRIERALNESRAAYFKRVCDIVGYEIPADVDLSMIKNEISQ